MARLRPVLPLVCVTLLAGAAVQSTSVVEDLRIGSPGADEYRFFGVGSIRAARGDQTVALVLNSSGWHAVAFNAGGVVTWRHAFAPNDVPTGLEALGDTLAVLSGSGSAATVSLLRIGSRDRIATFSVPEAPDRRWQLRGVVAGRLLMVDEPIVIGGGLATGSAPSADQPAYNVRYLDTRAGLVDGWRIVDSTPRPVVPHPRPGVATRIVLLMPWAPSVSFAAGVNEAYSASRDSYRIDARDVAGRVTRTINVEYTARRVDDSLRTAWPAAWKRGMVASLYADSIKARITDVPMPSTIPPIRGLLPAPDGGLAIVRRDLDKNPAGGSDSVRIDVVSREGAMLRRIALPAGTAAALLTETHLFTRVPMARATGASPDGDARPMFQIVRYRYR